jgi:hypothetical protein
MIMSPLNEDNAEKLEALLGPFSVQAVTAAAVTAGWQNANQYAVELSIPAATAGTVLIAVSADGVTYTTLEAARAVPASGGANIAMRVPSGFFVKLTPTTSVLANGYCF